MNVGFRINLAVACVSPPIGTSQADPKQKSGLNMTRGRCRNLIVGSWAVLASPREVR